MGQSSIAVANRFLMVSEGRDSEIAAAMSERFARDLAAEREHEPREPLDEDAAS